MAPEVRSTLAGAEKRVYAGQNESQAYIMYMHSIHGAGTLSSSPIQDQIQDQIRHLPRPPKVNQRLVGVAASSTSLKAATPATHCTRGSGKDKDKVSANPTKRPGGARATPDVPSSRASSSPHSPGHTPSQGTPSGTAAVSEPLLGNHLVNPQNNENKAASKSMTALAAEAVTLTGNNDATGRHRKSYTQASSTSVLPRQPSKDSFDSPRMESSQSPTQSNEGRSYEQYLPRGDDLISSDPVEKPVEPASLQSEHTSYTEYRTLCNDDTGAVNFDFLSTRPDTQASAPDTHGPDEPQHESPHQLDPETPAPLRNPFAGSRPALLRGSQMFKQTQFSSSYKAASPTSSRPSPDNLDLQNSISPNPIISSPLKRLGVGPSPIHGVPSSPPQLDIPYETSPHQYHEQPTPLKQDTVRGSKSLHSMLPRGPLDAYEPMHKSQERRDSSEQPGPEVESDENLSDDEARRHQRALLKKAAVARRLQSISFERPFATDDVVVPSTNTRNEKTRSKAARRYHHQCIGTTARDSQNAVGDSQDSQNAVEDSQASLVQLLEEHTDHHRDAVNDSQEDDAVQLGQEDHVSSNEAIVLDTLPNTAKSPSTSAPAAEIKDTSTKNASSGTRHGDAIPETSPTTLHPRPLGDLMPRSSDEPSKPGSFGSLPDSGRHLDSLFPKIRSNSKSQVQNNDRRSRRKSDPDRTPGQSTRTNETASHSSRRPKKAEIVETSPPLQSSPPAPAFSTRARLRGMRAQQSPTAPPTSSMSTLSVLSMTPAVSNNTTPLTQASPHADHLTPSSSTAETQTSTIDKTNRRASSGGASKAGHTKDLRMYNRHSRKSFALEGSVSTDELARSPLSSAPPAFDRSTTTRLSRLDRNSVREPPASRETSRGAKIFSGMAFAISFQAKQAGEKESHYNSRMGISNEIVNKIKQEGGKVLSSGFDQLFEISAVKNAETSPSIPQPDEVIKLVAAARNTGFTALIADGHSRKVKYMQALALGLPCIHERWVTTCVEKQRLVDWPDYLLCAGNSSFLGDAIRSRNLPSYDATSAKLREVIDARPRLLHGSRILLLMRKQDESKKEAYVFLARVLGASLSRVYTVEEARKQLKAAEDAGHPFDWIYTGGKVPSTFTASFSAPSLSAAGMKRKRKSDVDAGPPPKKVRTLSDELVIQSLILGRLMEDDEIRG